METGPSRIHVLVTGANSGLGFSICVRLIDEFLSKHALPLSKQGDLPKSLTVILTTRTQAKSNDTISRLQKQLLQYSSEQRQCITLQPEFVDLTSLLSIRRLAQKLNATTPHLSAIICNAGISGCIGMDWLKAFWTVTTDMVQAVTWPQFKLGGVGFVTNPQLPSPAAGEKTDAAKNEPPLGEVFTANLFGHYMLSHWLMPLLSASALPDGHPGRIVFVSSLDAGLPHFSISDPQCLLTACSYESSKRLSDILALTSRLPSTQPWTSTFLRSTPTSTLERPSKQTLPKIYVAHPGVCATAIVPLPWILNLAMILAFYISRFLGSPWHTSSAYIGATAPVWLALSDQGMLDNFETPPTASKTGGEAARPVKWGSCCDVRGNEGVMATEVEGWGIRGLESDIIDGRKGRKRGARKANKEDREKFEELGREAWKYMEELRGEWESRLQGSHNG